MSRRTIAWAATSTRLVVGAAVSVGLVLVTGVAVAAPWPGREAQPVSIAVTPRPSDTVLACTGSLLAAGRNVERAADLTAAAAQAVVSGSASAALEPEKLTAQPAFGDAGLVLTAAPDGDRPADAAAAGSAAVNADDLRGFAASACRPPLIESWLVAGATTTGSADLVLLSNPGDVPATVQLTFYGVKGASVPTGGRDLVVAARTQRVVPLAGLATGEGAPVVRVTSSGAPITAALQSSLTRVLLTGGVDQTGATAASANSVVVPGVVVPQSAVDAAAAGATTIARLLSPGVDAQATVTATAADGTQTFRQVVPLVADEPVEVDLSGLAAGAYTVRAQSQTPIVGAVWQTTGFGQNADFAWHSAAPDVSDDTLVAVPSGPSPTLSVTTSAASATVTLEPVSGAPASAVTATVTAGRTASVALVAGAVYRLRADAPVNAAVTYSGDGALAAFPVWPADTASAALTVYP